MANFLTRHRKPSLHIAFWLVYASFFIYQISYGSKQGPDWARVVPDFTFHIAGLLAMSYLNYFVLLPKYLENQRLGSYLARFLPIYAVLIYLFVLGKQAILEPLLDGSTWIYSPRFVSGVILASLLIVAFVGLLRFVEDYFRHEAERKESENNQLTSELRFLRAQINPHFLFNTLNNLYYLAVNESPQTPEVIAKLSGMMRYMLYQSNHPTVPLKEEIGYMENYIELERMRLNEDVPIAFEVREEDGDLAGQLPNLDGYRIAPLILITFLENAFKHGISNGGRGKSWITVQLTVNDGDLHYRVQNGKVSRAEKTVPDASGIGLTNVRRRLALVYPDKHELAIRETEDTYTVDLHLRALCPSAVLS
jgi:hypothetical protein